MRHGFYYRYWDPATRSRGFGENFNYERRNMQENAFFGVGQRLRLRQRFFWDDQTEYEFDDKKYLRHAIEVTESKLQFLKSKLNDIIEKKGEDKNA